MLRCQLKKQKRTPMRQPPFSVLTRGADKGWIYARTMPAYCFLSLPNPMYRGLCESSQWADSNEHQVHRVWKKNEADVDGWSQIYCPLSGALSTLQYSEKYYNIGTNLYILSIVSMRITVSGAVHRRANYVCADLWQIKALYTISRLFSLTACPEY